MPDILSVEQAKAQWLALIERRAPEEVELLDACGRVLAADAVSDIDVAPFDNSAMDGFALRASDLRGASDQTPVALEVIAHIAAGDWCETEVVAGTAARIMTGAPMPPGADTVVKVEETSVLSGDGGVGSQVRFSRAPQPGENVRHRGEEVKAGEAVLRAGERLGPAAIGLLASTGHARVCVYRRPRVAVLSTGSELVDIDTVPPAGKIRNSNNYSLAAQVLEAGGIPVAFPNITDTLEATKAALLEAAVSCDLIITSGGVSVGDFDYVKPALEATGQLFFCKVNMRPGNPQTMGMVGSVPFFGLPGNPTSTFVGFEIFVRPAIRKMWGEKHLERPVTRARLATAIQKKQVRRYFTRGRVRRTDDGALVAELCGDQSSALLTTAHRANCLMILPEGVAPVPADSEVDCIRLDIEENACL
ncbi:MAG: molybdopterin molybdotransferase MoeA [Actinomycetia bacterium]|nr:molybdopterin molybdotransferase MoeA [Actinomycetes bacterium]